MSVERVVLDEQLWELRDSMLRVAISILHHRQNAEDAVSNAILQAYRKRDSLRNDDALKSWLLRITANCCYDLVRKDKRERGYAEGMQPGVQMFDYQENTLFDMLTRLPLSLMQVLNLYYYENYSTAEIADILGLSCATVRMRMTRGRKLLKQMLQEGEEADETRSF